MECFLRPGPVISRFSGVHLSAQGAFDARISLNPMNTCQIHPSHTLPLIEQVTNLTTSTCVPMSGVHAGNQIEHMYCRRVQVNYLSIYYLRTLDAAAVNPVQAGVFGPTKKSEI